MAGLYFKLLINYLCHTIMEELMYDQLPILLQLQEIDCEIDKLESKKSEILLHNSDIKLHTIKI